MELTKNKDELDYLRELNNKEGYLEIRLLCKNLTFSDILPICCCDPLQIISVMENLENEYKNSNDELEIGAYYSMNLKFEFMFCKDNENSTSYTISTQVTQSQIDDLKLYGINATKEVNESILKELLIYTFTNMLPK